MQQRIIHQLHRTDASSQNTISWPKDTNKKCLRVTQVIQAAPSQQAPLLSHGRFYTGIDKLLRHRQNVGQPERVSIAIVIAAHKYEATSRRPTSRHEMPASGILAVSHGGCEAWSTGEDEESIAAVFEFDFLYFVAGIRGKTLESGTIHCSRV